MNVLITVMDDDEYILATVLRRLIRDDIARGSEIIRDVTIEKRYQP